MFIWILNLINSLIDFSKKDKFLKELLLLVISFLLSSEASLGLSPSIKSVFIGIFWFGKN